jgi:hypothetical protein
MVWLSVANDALMVGKMSRVRHGDQKCRRRLKFRASLTPLMATAAGSAATQPGSRDGAGDLPGTCYELAGRIAK